MQFHIRTLLALMVAVSLLCGLVFAAPPVVCIPVLCAILWVSPAVWVNGIVFGRGAWRAFFLGGLLAGLVPHLGALYFSFMIVGGLFDGGSLGDFLEGDGPFPNLYVAIGWLVPGVFAFLGGISGAVTCWLLQPAKGERAAKSPPEGEYLIVSGRLTTSPVPRAATPD